MTNLTSNEAAVLKSVYLNNFGDGPGSEIWADCINDSAAPSGIEGKSLSGVVSSLSAKGMINCFGDGRDAGIQLTDEGLVVGGELIASQRQPAQPTHFAVRLWTDQVEIGTYLFPAETKAEAIRSARAAIKEEGFSRKLGTIHFAARAA